MPATGRLSDVIDIGGPKASPEFQARLRAARANSRVIIEADGTYYRVYELELSPGDNSLVIEGTEVFRRLKEFQKDWRELDDAALLALKPNR